MRMTIGTDIVTIHRFHDFTKDINNPTLKKAFTQKELDYCFTKGDIESHLAARFAGKEATIKALYSRDITDVWYNDVEILNKQNGVPYVTIDKAKLKNLKCEISLSHCEEKAIAFVVIYGNLKEV